MRGGDVDRDVEQDINMGGTVTFFEDVAFILGFMILEAVCCLLFMLPLIGFGFLLAWVAG